MAVEDILELRCKLTEVHSTVVFHVIFTIFLNSTTIRPLLLIYFTWLFSFQVKIMLDAFFIRFYGALSTAFYPMIRLQRFVF